MLVMKDFNKWFESKMKRVGKFSMWQWATLKTSLVFFGVLFGAYLSDWVLQYQIFFWVLSIVGYIYILSIILPTKEIL